MVAPFLGSLFVSCNERANPRGNAIQGRPVDGVEQAHSTRPGWKNTGNFIGPKLGTVAEITLQRTDTTHDLSSESREAIARPCTTPTPPPHHHLPLTSAPSPTLCTLSPRIYHSLVLPPPQPTFVHRSNPFHRFSPRSPSHPITPTHTHTHPHTLLTTLFSGSRISTRSSGVLISCTLELGSVLPQ